MPSISIIVPCYNEQTTIRELLNAIYEQSTPRSDLEVVIADGMSSDGTRTLIADFQNSHPDLSITIVDNHKRSIPAGLNIALKQARGGIIIRFDAHSIPATDYIRRCVQDLEAGLGENVGGVWEIHPNGKTWIAESIAAAAAHPIGVGDALYRHARKAEAVDTVPFGAFKRELLATVGFFDESLLTNEDYEFNARIRKAGGTVWLDPAIRSVYFSRADLSSLAKQYFRYGFWKWRMLRRYPETLRWRQGLPPLFVLSVVGFGILGAFLPLLWMLLGAELIVYLLILSTAGVLEAIKRGKAYLIPGFPTAIAIMHICWGSGFLWSIIMGVFPSNDPERN